MLQALNADDGDLVSENRFSYDQVSNDLPPEAGKQQDLIDYILIRANEALVQCADRKIQIHQRRWCLDHKDLSDHYSIETEIYFQNRPDLYTVRSK